MALPVHVCRDETSLDRRIAAIASRQKGLITRPQLLGLGAPRTTIDQRVRRGALYAVHRGVYAVGHQAPNEGSQPLSAVLAVGGDAVVSHVEAALLLSLRVPRRLREPETVDVTHTGPHRRHRPGIRVHRTIWLPPGQRTRTDGIPATTAARTIVDLLPRLADRELERLLDTAIVESRASVSALMNVAVGRRASRLIDLLDPKRGTTATRSDLEEAMLALCRRGGLPEPEVNATIAGLEVDFLWRARRLVVEADGHRYHHTRPRIRRAAERDAILRQHGLAVLRFDEDAITGTPERVLVTVARGLG